VRACDRIHERRLYTVVRESIAWPAIGGSGGARVTFHGVRGSTPCHGDEIRRYGGNTSCVSLVVPGEDPLVFDLGTGLRYLGQSGVCNDPYAGTCLLTHLHWDHVQGLPFFVPVLNDGAEFDVYGPVQDDGRSVYEVFDGFVRPPLFPVTIDTLPGAIRFHDVGDEDFNVGSLAVRSRLVPHVGATLGYRVSGAGFSMAYIPDLQQPIDGTKVVYDSVRDLAEGVDLLIHDSQYTPREFEQKRTWGHCTVEYAVWSAVQLGARRLALFHHDPSHHDDIIDELLRCSRGVGAQHGLDVFAAYEGLSVELG
jgi:phosphoribosyl 1,2-cyclic phosphodiesterase